MIRIGGTLGQPIPTLPVPALPVPTLPVPTLPVPTLPVPTLPTPTVTPTPITPYEPLIPTPTTPYEPLIKAHVVPEDWIPMFPGDVPWVTPAIKTEGKLLETQRQDALRDAARMAIYYSGAKGRKYDTEELNKMLSIIRRAYNRIAGAPSGTTDAQLKAALMKELVKRRMTHQLTEVELKGKVEGANFKVGQAIARLATELASAAMQHTGMTRPGTIQPNRYDQMLGFAESHIAKRYHQLDPPGRFLVLYEIKKGYTEDCCPIVGNKLRLLMEAQALSIVESDLTAAGIIRGKLRIATRYVANDAYGNWAKTAGRFATSGAIPQKSYDQAIASMTAYMRQYHMSVPDYGSDGYAIVGHQYTDAEYRQWIVNKLNQMNITPVSTANVTRQLFAMTSACAVRDAIREIGQKDFSIGQLDRVLGYGGCTRKSLLRAKTFGTPLPIKPKSSFYKMPTKNTYVSQQLFDSIVTTAVGLAKERIVYIAEFRKSALDPITDEAWRKRAEQVLRSKPYAVTPGIEPPTITPPGITPPTITPPRIIPPTITRYELARMGTDKFFKQSLEHGVKYARQKMGKTHPVLLAKLTKRTFIRPSIFDPLVELSIFNAKGRYNALVRKYPDLAKEKNADAIPLDEWKRGIIIVLGYSTIKIARGEEPPPELPTVPPAPTVSRTPTVSPAPTVRPPIKRGFTFNMCVAYGAKAAVTYMSKTHPVLAAKRTQKTLIRPSIFDPLLAMSIDRAKRRYKSATKKADTFPIQDWRYWILRNLSTVHKLARGEEPPPELPKPTVPAVPTAPSVPAVPAAPVLPAPEMTPAQQRAERERQRIAALKVTQKAAKKPKSKLVTVMKGGRKVRKWVYLRKDGTYRGINMGYLGQNAGHGGRQETLPPRVPTVGEKLLEEQRALRRRLKEEVMSRAERFKISKRLSQIGRRLKYQIPIERKWAQSRARIEAQRARRARKIMTREQRAVAPRGAPRGPTVGEKLLEEQRALRRRLKGEPISRAERFKISKRLSQIGRRLKYQIPIERKWAQSRAKIEAQRGRRARRRTIRDLMGLTGYLGQNEGPGGQPPEVPAERPPAVPTAPPQAEPPRKTAAEFLAERQRRRMEEGKRVTETRARQIRQRGQAIREARMAQMSTAQARYWSRYSAEQRRKMAAQIGVKAEDSELSPAEQRRRLIQARYASRARAISPEQKAAQEAEQRRAARARGQAATERGVSVYSPEFRRRTQAAARLRRPARRRRTPLQERARAALPLPQRTSTVPAVTVRAGSPALPPAPALPSPTVPTPALPPTPPLTPERAAEVALAAQRAAEYRARASKRAVRFPGRRRAVRRPVSQRYARKTPERPFRIALPARFRGDDLSQQFIQKAAEKASRRREAAIRQAYTDQLVGNPPEWRQKQREERAQARAARQEAARARGCPVALLDLV